MKFFNKLKNNKKIDYKKVIVVISILFILYMLMYIYENKSRAIFKFSGTGTVASDIVTDKSDKEAPKLTVINLQSTDSSNPTITTSEKFIVSGTVTDNIKVKSVTVNGTKVTVNSDGTWQYTLTLTVNITTKITVEALDILDNKTTETRYVHYQGTASYKVQHWQQNVNGTAGNQNSSNYTLKDTDTLSGRVGTEITPNVKTYTGFNSPSTQKTTIKADGSTIINYYYTRKSYTVSLTKGTGISEVAGAGTYIYGQSVTIDTTITPGYHFVNWTGQSTVTAKSHTFTMPDSNVSYTSNGAANVIHFKYYSNNGSQTNFVNWDATPTQSWPDNHYDYRSGTYAQTYRGYSPTGYYGTTTTGGTLVAENEIFSSYTALCDKYGVDYYAAETTINIYCQWTINTYTVNYNANGGTGTVNSQSVKYGDKITIASNAFSKRGYYWSGWSTRTNNTDDGFGWTGWTGNWVYINGQYGIENNTLNLYARWSPDTYTIKYMANGGSGSMSDQSVSYGSTVTIKSNEFTRTNYRFLGWSTKSDNTDDGHGWTGWSGSWSYIDGQYGIANKTLILYARWQIVDSTPPSCTLSYSGSTLTINSSASDLASSPYSFDKSSYSTTRTKSATSAGTYYGYVKDQVGNVGSCSINLVAHTITYNVSNSCIGSPSNGSKSSCIAASGGSCSITIPQISINTSSGYVCYLEYLNTWGWALSSGGVRTYNGGATLTLSSSINLYASKTSSSSGGGSSGGDDDSDCAYGIKVCSYTDGVCSSCETGDSKGNCIPCSCPC